MRKSVAHLAYRHFCSVKPVMVMPASALASVPKLSFPEFTLRVASYPYDVPPVVSTDPYTGRSEITEAGYHVENKSIEVTIKNQPFTPYHDANGNLVKLYYCLNFKGHFEGRTFDPSNTGSYFLPSDSNYTVISFALGQDSSHSDLWHSCTSMAGIVFRRFHQQSKQFE